MVTLIFQALVAYPERLETYMKTHAFLNRNNCRKTQKNPKATVYMQFSVNFLIKQVMFQKNKLESRPFFDSIIKLKKKRVG